MRIALVILHADPARGGAERYTADLAEGLRARGHEVSLIASSFAAGPLSAGGILLEAGGKTRLARYRKFLDSLDAHLLAHAYDIVHAMLPVRQCDVYHPHAGIAAEAVRSGHLKYEGAAARLISRVANSLNVKRRTFAAVERALLHGPRPPIALCLSEYVKRGVTAHYSLSPSYLATLFNATDLNRFDPNIRPHAGDEIRQRFQIAADRVIALMIAQDFRRKGLKQAIEAVAQIQNPRLVLLVVGKQESAPYRRIAEAKGIADRVIFAGQTTDAYAFYQAADFFVLPTRHDPCSLVVLEALTMGVPVISSAFNGACEIMEDGRHGYILSDPTDVDALADALKLMMNDATRLAMSEQCLALRPVLSYEHHLDQLIAIYDSIKTKPHSG